MRTTPTAVSAVLLTAGFLVPEREPSAGQSGIPQDLEAYRTEAEALARDGSWWYASNEDYLEADGENAPEAYGIRHWVQTGGLSGGGCLWSIRGGEPVAIHWWFHSGWDVAEGRPFHYQAHASGQGSGMGFGTVMEGDVSVMDQEFSWLGEEARAVSQVRHRSRWLDADTRVSESFDRVDGEWIPRRTYTWDRRVSGPIPCGPER